MIIGDFCGISIIQQLLSLIINMANLKGVCVSQPRAAICRQTKNGGWDEIYFPSSALPAFQASSIKHGPVSLCWAVPPGSSLPLCSVLRRERLPPCG